MASPTILVVDDDEMNREILEAFLKLDNYQVTLATTGSSALAEIERNIPDLVILDVRLPDMDGYSICQQLRAQDVTASLPVMIVTGYEGAEERNTALNAGANDFLSRPFSSDELITHVRHLLNGS